MGRRRSGSTPRCTGWRVPGPRRASSPRASSSPAAVVLLSVVLARRSEAPPLVLGVGLWLAAASPFAFVWSRQGWDNSLLAGFVALTVAVLARPGAVRAGAAALAGLLLGLCLGTHLMALPFAAAVVLVLLTERRAWRDRLVAARRAGARGRAGAASVPAALSPATPGRRRPAAPVERPSTRLGARGRGARGAVRADRGRGPRLLPRCGGPSIRRRARRSARPSRVLGPLVAAVVAAGALLGLVLGRLRAASPGLRRVARLGALDLGAARRLPRAARAPSRAALPAAGPLDAAGRLGARRRHAVARAPTGRLGRRRLWRWRSALGVRPPARRGWGGSARREGRGASTTASRSGRSERALAEACAAHTPGIALEVQVVVFPQSLRSLAAHRAGVPGPPGGDLRPGLPTARPLRLDRGDAPVRGGLRCAARADAQW